MADEFKASTCGVDHIGLSVGDLVSTRRPSVLAQGQAHRAASTSSRTQWA
jgi:hypothetical protein